MIATKAKSRARTPVERVADLLAPPILLSTPFISYVRYHDYGLWRPEIWLCIGLIVGLGLILSGLISLRPMTIRPIVVGLLVALFIDTQFRLGRALPGLFYGSRPEGDPASGISLFGLPLSTPLLGLLVFVGLLLALILLIIMMWLVRRHLGMIITVSFGVILLATALLPQETVARGEVSRKQSVQPRADLPPVVHLVLDEQIGIEGVPIDIPGGSELRQELKDFYEGLGFTVFGRAYSSFAETRYSIGDLVNARITAGIDTFVAETDDARSGSSFGLLENAWFRRLSEIGYRIHVYQSAYLDFCAVEDIQIDYCFVYPINSIHSLAGVDLANWAKVRLIFGRFIYGQLKRSLVRRIYLTVQSGDPKTGAKRRAGSLREWFAVRPDLTPLSAARVVDRIAVDLRAAPRGTAFFAHLLLPHKGYIFDDQCRPRADVETWLTNVSFDQPVSLTYPVLNTSKSRVRAYERYFEQVRCTHRLLELIFRELKAAGVFEDALVIVHGDHGSRIALAGIRLPDASIFSDRDLVDH